MIKQKKQRHIRIIPLGGLGEVGRNMLLLEYGRQILIIDMGFRLPEESMPGIDYIIPNVSYLEGKEKNIVGVVFTHGHYDHIGAVPYLIDKLGNPRLYASALTKGIIARRQAEFPEKPQVQIKEVRNGSKISLGPFKIEFFSMNHNIPDNLGLFIETPLGNIVHTSDFKFDKDPIYDKPTDLEKLKAFGARNILLLMSDSTDAEEEGHSMSEAEIMKNLEEIFKKARGRIITSTFASLINRIQQIITLSEKYNRKVAIDGYSMKNNVELAKNLGYLKFNKKTLIPAKHISNYPDSRITVICTGAQGEGGAILMRIANREYKFLRLKRGDAVILSSSVVPGNERTVQVLKDEVLRQGANVFHYQMMDIHAGGHAKKQELEEIVRLIKPRFFLPIHGQYSMLNANADIAKRAGVKERNIAVVENGQIINLRTNKITIEKETIPCNHIMVDGLGIGDVGEVVLRDRQMLARDGMFVIVVVVDKTTGRVRGSPDIISRGFVYLRESKKLLKDTRKKTIDIVERATGSGRVVNWVYIKDQIKNKIGDFLYSRTERRPIILPVVIEV